MTAENYLAVSIHQSRKARLAFQRGNLPAARRLVCNAFHHAGAASASPPPEYLSEEGFHRRLALAEAIAHDTARLVER